MQIRRSRDGHLATLVLLGVVAVACGGRAQGHSGEVVAGSGSDPDVELPGAAAGGAMAESGGRGVALPGQAGVSTRGDAGAGGVGAGGNNAADGGASQGGEPGAGGAGAPSAPDCDPVRFEDAELESAVRAALGKPNGELSAADVAGLTELTTQSIESLSGIECLQNLSALDIGSLPAGKVTDLQPLAGLTELQILNINRNPVASLAPLGKLPRLQQLFAAKIPVPLDVAPLGHATKLELLDLGADTVPDLTPLAGATALRKLILRQGSVGEPGSIAALTSLEELEATAVFDDAQPLAGLTKLTFLRVGGKAIAHASALGALENLQLLDIAATGVADLGFVVNMSKLATLSAPSNQISDISSLVGLLELRSVALGANPLVCATQANNLAKLTGRGVEVFSDCP
jgi:internalin A